MKRCVILPLVISLASTAIPVIADEQPTELEWFINYSALPSNWNLDEPIFKTITDATNVVCNFNIPAEDASTKLNLLMISGEMPDLITTDDTTLIAEMIDADMVWNLEELFDTYLPEAKIKTDFPADIKEVMIERDQGWYAFPSHMLSDDGAEMYGYPTEEIAQYYEAAKYSTGNAIYLFKPVLEEMEINIDDIKTETDLMNVLEKINDANLTNDAGSSIYTVMTDGVMTMEYSIPSLTNIFGAMPVSEDGHYQSMVYSDQYKDAIKFLNNCAQKGYITDTQLIMDEPSVVSICNSGRAACFIGSLSTLKSGTEVEDLWDSVGAITSDKGYTPVLGYNPSTGAGWLSTLVSKKTKNPEACARFIDYMNSPEGLTTHMYGIKDIDYIIDENNCLHRTDVGAAKIEDGITGMFGFYAFHNTNFARSIEYKDVSNPSPTLKYAMCDNVEIYDSSLFDLPSGYIANGSDEAYIQTETKNYMKSELPKIILAENNEVFESMYVAMLDQLDVLGLRKLDEYIDIEVQKKCEEKEIELKPIN